MKRIVEFLRVPSAPWLLAAAVAAMLAVVAVWWGGLNQDEGWYLYAAQLVRDGKLPYRDFFFTQGPTMPFVYSALAPIWQSAGSPLHGLLGGRIVTLVFGLAAVACAMALARRLAPPDRRGVAALAVFAMLACNLYHLYFTTIPKTYALGGLFVMAGYLLLAVGRPMAAFAAGLSLAFATGTRISLLMILPVVGFGLLLNFRTFRWCFLLFGIGAALGLFLTYGLFALDDAGLRGLLAAQRYHAARGGFDLFFSLGSVSRLVRGYAVLGVVLAAALSARPCVVDDGRDGDPAVRPLLWMVGLGFAAVFLLQLSAPFPYDDYQVPVMGLPAVLVAVAYSRRCQGAWLPVLAACLLAFGSPLLQEWATYGQDRFWSRKKEKTELAKLQDTARVLDVLDPGGKTLLTQDLYLAVEAGRKVPEGFEMGPFCYFPDISTETARSMHVLNRKMMEEILESAPCSAAACSGYAFAISAPTCVEVPESSQTAMFRILKKNYDLAHCEPDFGQNATAMLILKRREAAK